MALHPDHHMKPTAIALMDSTLFCVVFELSNELPFCEPNMPLTDGLVDLSLDGCDYLLGAEDVGIGLLRPSLPSSQVVPLLFRDADVCSMRGEPVSAAVPAPEVGNVP